MSELITAETVFQFMERFGSTLKEWKERRTYLVDQACLLEVARKEASRKQRLFLCGEPAEAYLSALREWDLLATDVLQLRSEWNELGVRVAVAAKLLEAFIFSNSTSVESAFDNL